MNKKLLAILTLLGAFSFANAADAVAAAPTTDPVMFTVNNLWILLGAALVFIMHPGFALVETGLTRAKNSVNILTKNVATVAIGLLVYLFVGFGLMYPGDSWVCGEFLGWAGSGLPTLDADIMGPQGIQYFEGRWSWFSDFIFQGMFACTAATIVSGAVAGRTKLSAYLIFAIVYVGLGYSIIGSWGWGGGWLADLGFYDLAGSTFVHSVGGWAALVGAIMVGPRIGKYVKGKAKAIPGCNMGFATLGVFLLWFGWFGFNGASVFSADPVMVAYVFTTTSLAAAAGIAGALITSWIVQKKPDLSMTLNGCLAGLVGITAGADCVSINASVLIGLIAGILVVFSVYFFDKIMVDDPVGALSVHLVCGVWGTLATGIFSPDHSVVTQLIGIAAVAAASISISFIIFLAIKLTIGLRVSESEEMRGLDISEHGMEAYSGFQFFSNE